MFSVIIPVYNVEQYLVQCLDGVCSAIAGQDEIIISVGHSWDSSDLIAARYAAENKNVRVIAQDGRGLSNARNCAMHAAKGDYVLFVDSDDYVDAACLKKLLQDIRSGKYTADVIMTDFYRAFPNGENVLVDQIGHRELRGLDQFGKVIAKRQCFWNIWRNVYSRSFLVENDLCFADSRYCEDIDFTVKVLQAMPDIAFVNAPYYHYRMDRESSLMNTVSCVRIEQTEFVLRSGISALRGLDTDWSKLLADRLQFEYILNLALICEVSRADRTEAVQIFKEYRQSLTPTGDWVVSMTRYCVDVFGLKAVAKLLTGAKWLKRKNEHRVTALVR